MDIRSQITSVHNLTLKETRAFKKTMRGTQSPKTLDWRSSCHKSFSKLRRRVS